MTIVEKLQNLKALSDVVLYQWRASQRRIAGSFIPLSDLRFVTLSCNAHSVVYSSAAPILYMSHGRSVIQFRDSDVMTVLGGRRRGINIASSLLQDGEEAAEARFCSWREVTEDCPKWLERRIVTMGTSMLYPVTRIIMPELFRISKNINAFRPVFTTSLIKIIGGERGESSQTLLEKFRQNITRIGFRTDEGYVVSNDYVAAGGFCVASSRGISMRAGSVVHMMPLSAFTKETDTRHWKITTAPEGKETRNDVETENP